MRILVVDLQYNAPLIFFNELSNVSHCVFDVYENYQKMSFRNRCTVAGANGVIHLSVPLFGGRNQKTPMHEVRIRNSERWQDLHWKTITSAYNKSPWLDYFRDELEELYSTPYDLLHEWNFACVSWIAAKMSIPATLELSKEYIRSYPEKEFVDWRNRLLPSTINNLFPEVKKYPQVFEDRWGFIPNLSILDYLFCAGPKLMT